MKRKDFNRLAILGAAGSVLSCKSTQGTVKDGTVVRKDIKKIKPRKLKEGDTIGLIAPGSAFTQEAYERTIDNIKTMGFRYKNAKNLFLKYGYLAGDDKSRIEDIHQMFADPEVDAIWCVRGGYGTTRLLYDLDYELIKANPKILMGYSDITALLQAIHEKTGLVTFHGPVGSTELTDYIISNFQSVLMTIKKNTRISNQKSDNTTDEFNSEFIVPGHMKGQLAGGNLTLLASLAGTEFQLDASGKLVFIEDVGEKPYRIDRMLTQLLQVSNLNKANGILLGRFNDCDVEPGDNTSLRLKETLIDRLGYLDIPVYYGFSFGHVDEMCILPVGVEAGFDLKKEELILFESAVV